MSEEELRKKAVDGTNNMEKVLLEAGYITQPFTEDEKTIFIDLLIKDARGESVPEFVMVTGKKTGKATVEKTLRDIEESIKPKYIKKEK